MTTKATRKRKEKKTASDECSPCDNQHDWIEVKGDCCAQSHNKVTAPKADLVPTVGNNGNSLSVALTVFHNCGIRNYVMTIRLTKIADPLDSWVIRPGESFTCEAPMNKDKTIELKWGPGERRKLPTNLAGWKVRITGNVVSCCDTSREFDSTFAVL